MRRQIKDRDGGGGVRCGIEGLAVCDERHGSEANEGFARAGACREAWRREGLFVGRSRRSKINHSTVASDPLWSLVDANSML